MKKLTTLTLALAVCSTLAGQSKRIISPERSSQKVTFEAIKQMELRGENASLVSARQVANPSVSSPSGKTNMAVSPVELGRASNAFTHVRTEQNQVFACDSLDLVTYIHRQDVTVWGGGTTANGMYRYDLSTDGGTSFVSDIGPVQTVYTDYGRYPQITGFNPGATSNPFDSKFVWNGPTNHFPTPGWVGHVYGLADVTTGTVTSTENYMTAMNSLLPGGLCQGAPGVFWNVDWAYDGTTLMDSLFVFRGVYNSGLGDVEWTKYRTITMNWDAANTDKSAVGPNIAFSPDGQTGWITFLSDMSGGQNGALAPVAIKSTDGGNTWGTPMEVDLLASASWMADTLQSLWVDSLGNPASNGIPTTAFDYDMTVDGTGNPHIAVSIGTVGTGQAYSISSGLAMFMADVYSTDGGATWKTDYLAPMLSLRGEFGVPDANGDLLSMDNNCQVGRDESGNHIFFAWVDTDSLVGGFGATDNVVPNLRIVGKRVNDGYLTCWKRITDGDLIWEGRALFPAISPIVLTNGSNYNLPIVMMDMINNDQSQPVKFWYFGADATFSEGDFNDPATYSRGWTGQCYDFPTWVKNPALDQGIVLHQSFPNPNNGQATIRYELPNAMNVTLEVSNLFGQTIAILASGNQTAGMHEVVANTQDLAAGVYMYTLRAGDQLFTKRMIVE